MLDENAGEMFEKLLENVGENRAGKLWSIPENPDNSIVGVFWIERYWTTKNHSKTL